MLTDFIPLAIAGLVIYVGRKVIYEDSKKNDVLVGKCDEQKREELLKKFSDLQAQAHEAIRRERCRLNALEKADDILEEAYKVRYMVKQLEGSDKWVIFLHTSYSYGYWVSLMPHVSFREAQEQTDGVAYFLMQYESIIANPHNRVWQKTEIKHTTYYHRVQCPLSKPRTTTNVYEAMFDSADDALDAANDIRNREIAYQAHHRARYV